MLSILLRNDPREEDQLVADLWEEGTVGIEEADGAMRAYFNETVDLDSFLERYRHRVLEVRVESDRNQVATTQDKLDPILVGNRFFLVPPWSTHPTPLGRLRLSIDAKASFGTGRHESTQLVMEALERFIEPRQTVVDVGCGSGILSAAAKMLGAANVISCDIDTRAIAEAQILLDTRLFQGSPEAIQGGTADLVLANLTRPILEALRENLLRIVKPGGRLIVSGFLADDVPSGYVPIEVYERDGWQCWVCENR